MSSHQLIKGVDKMLRNLSLKDKVALVTGAAQGIGYSIACGLAEAGADIAIADVKSEIAQRSADEISQNHSVKAISIKVDSTQIEFMKDEVFKTFGKINILVNNAGVVIRKKGLDTSPKEWDWLMNINLRGPFLCSKAICPIFLKQGGGNIINVLSAQVNVVEPERVAYITSKTGLLGFTRALAVELARDNIRVNAIAPGWTKTEMNIQALEGDQERLNYIQGKMPMARMAETEEIANLAVFLASDASAYITGQAIFVDGGWTLW
jgi:NAD(P)-dependent dehydrogenase (short-subunit alcohol dehydrogenase family)